MNAVLDLDATAALSEPYRCIGPTFLSGGRGGAVRGEWALSSDQGWEGVRIEWISDGRVLRQDETTTTVEFALDGARSGERLARSVRVVLHGPDWRMELPAVRVEIAVG